MDRCPHSLIWGQPQALIRWPLLYAYAPLQPRPPYMGHPPGGQSSSPSPAFAPTSNPLFGKGLFLLNSPRLTSGPQPPLLLAKSSPIFR